MRLYSITIIIIYLICIIFTKMADFYKKKEPGQTRPFYGYILHSEFFIHFFHGTLHHL